MKQQSGKIKIGASAASSTGNVFDRIGQGVVCIDTGLNLTYVNDTASRLLQRQSDNLMGRGLRDADTRFQEHSPTPQGLLLDVHCLATDEGVLVVFHRAVRRNRREKAHRNSEPPSDGRTEEPARNVQPGIEHASGYMSTEEPRWETWELLQAVLENAPSGLVVADRSGRIIMASEAAKEIFGAPSPARRTDRRAVISS